jgi:signal peptidase I
MWKSKSLRNLVILGGVLIVGTKLVTDYAWSPAKVSGDSMYPTLHNKDRGFINRFATVFNYGDIIIFKEDGELLVKRILGKPGDTITIRNGQVYRNNLIVVETYLKSETYTSVGIGSQIVILRTNEYFVLGDNRDNSSDSRDFGAVNKSNILGKFVRL